MKKNWKQILGGILAVLLLLVFGTGGDKTPAASTPVNDSYSQAITLPAESESLPESAGQAQAPDSQAPPAAAIDENGSYNSKEEVALYIHTYGRLPDNYISKKEAEKLGWSGGSVERYAPGKAIGGSRFGNYEGLLPEKDGRSYTECDIDTQGKDSRGAKRIVFSNDGLVYYTDDHYESFTLLYGEP